MATTKQIAARKLFVKRVRAGEFAKNPAKRKPAAKKKVVSKPSQITKRAPTKRLKVRRAANTKPGYFPNPIRNEFPHLVGHYKNDVSPDQRMIAAFASRITAVEYAEAKAKQYPKFRWFVKS